LGGGDELVELATLYRCHGLPLAHKDALFTHLCSHLFGARYDVLLYDLTSTCFECDVPDAPDAPRRFGYARDRRGDYVQVVFALVVTPECLPLAYEMLPGNTADKTKPSARSKCDLAIRPAWHPLPGPIEAHLFIAFLWPTACP
jgi:hypothetical protein